MRTRASLAANAAVLLCALALIPAGRTRAGEPPSGPVRIEAGEFKSYLLLEIPEGYKDDAEWPLVVGLHGMGDSAEAFLGCWGGLPARRGCFFAALRGDQEAPCLCGRCGGTVRTWGGKSESFVLWAIEEVRKRYKIDAGRVYLAGFSAGGFATWWIGLKNPRLFAAIVPCAAPLPPGLPKEEMERAKSLPILGFAGDRDPSCLGMRRSFLALREAGHLNAEYKEIPGLGHEVPVGELGGILDRFEALAAERRDNAPTLLAELEKGRRAVEGKAWAEAVPILLGVADSGVHGPFTVEARELLGKAGEEGNRRVEQALQKAGAGDRKGAVEALKKIALEFGGLECARKAEEAAQSLLDGAKGGER
jgi:poly(3-hydroxybutyrate) depolymerase